MVKRILLSLDGLEMAEKAIEIAELQAKTFDAELYILRVISPLAKTYRAGKASVSAIKSAERELQLIAHGYLEAIEDQIRRRGLNVQATTRYGLPHTEIIQFAKNNKIDMIVMAKRGESGVTRWLLGSITDHVVRGSSIPVLVVPVKHNVNK